MCEQKKYDYGIAGKERREERKKQRVGERGVNVSHCEKMPSTSQGSR